MTSDAEIRTWAREGGIPVPARGKLPQSVRDTWEQAHPDEPGGDNLKLSVDDVPGGDGPDGPELAPQAPTGPLTASAHETAEFRPLPPPGPRFAIGKRTPKEARPARRRVSIEGLAAGLWGLLGHGAQSQGFVPTGRVLALQAPVAGVILEDSLKGTVADKLLQPLARMSERGTELAALLGPPVLVSVITARPELAPMLLGPLKGTLKQWVVIAGPKMKKKEEREKKAMAQMGMDEDDVTAMIDGMISAIFGPGEAEDAAA